MGGVAEVEVLGDHLGRDRVHAVPGGEEQLTGLCGRRRPGSQVPEPDSFIPLAEDILVDGPAVFESPLAVDKVQGEVDDRLPLGLYGQPDELEQDLAVLAFLQLVQLAQCLDLPV